jgi:phenylpyruvate tautomerase PptA (4-oxalocrotonate tautomerase family)
MPFTRISLNTNRPAAVQRAIADGVQNAMVAAIGIPAGDRFQVVDQLQPGSLIFDESYIGLDREDVVFVQITLVRGRTVEMKKALFTGIADELEKAGVRREDVFVSLIENSREDWSLGGGDAQILDTELVAKWGWTPPAG